MARPEIKTLRVHLDTRSYNIVIGQNILTKPSLITPLIQTQQVCIVTNETIAPLYLQTLCASLADKKIDCVILKDGEMYKNMASLRKIYDKLVSQNHRRDTTLIALGGGVIGDITGFAAATYQRGVSFIQIPTTLLAQVDASVGGKTAINHPQGKNLIGSIYQPKQVIIDIATLKTLHKRAYKAGMAEIIKYALLAGGKLYHQVEQALNAPMNAQQLIDIIHACCAYKAHIIEQDEHESHIRALLNLGHTTAHALEAYTHYQRWLHGEAVAIGLHVAALISQELGFIDKTIVNNLVVLLKKAGLPVNIPRDIELAKLWSFIQKDKKAQHHSLRFILIKAIGHCYIETNMDETLVMLGLTKAVEGV